MQDATRRGRRRRRCRRAMAWAAAVVTSTGLAAPSAVRAEVRPPLPTPAAEGPGGRVVDVGTDGDPVEVHARVRERGSVLRLRSPLGTHELRPPRPGDQWTGRLAAGPDLDQDGIRVLIAEAWSGPSERPRRRRLAEIDVPSGVIRAVGHPTAGGPDPWSLLAADANADGRVDADDLLALVSGAAGPAGGLRDGIERVLAAWGSSVRELSPALGVPLECEAPCRLSECPWCVHDACCRLPDGTPCGVCFVDPPDGGGGGHGGGGHQGGGGGGGGGGRAPGGTGADPIEPPSPPCPTLVPLDGDADVPTERLGARRCWSVVLPPGCVAAWTLDGPACFLDADGACTDGPVTTANGDPLCVRFTGCGPVRLTGVSTCCVDPFERSVTVVGVDLDLDTDHDDPRGRPSGSDAEDQAEDRAPGRLVMAADADRDGDGLPAWADGIGAWAGAETTRAPSDLLPVHLTLPSADLGPCEIRLEYDASRPDRLPLARPASFEGLDPPPGTFRVWRRRHGRDRRPLEHGGDFLAPGVWYRASHLGGDAGPTVLWLEAVRGSRDPDDEDTTRLRVEVRLPGTDGPGAPAADCLVDAVRITAIGMERLDLRHWGPVAAPGSRTGVALSDPDLRRPANVSDHVAGAIADGVSPVLLRFVPDVFEAAGVRPRITIERHRRDGTRIATVDRVGSLHSIPTGSGAPIVPALPVRADDASVTVASATGPLLWIPPSGLVRSGVDGLVLPSALTASPDDPAIGLSVSVSIDHGGSLGATGLWLRDPPLVRVHGLLSSPDEAWGAGGWDELGPRPMLDVDWRRSGDGSRPTDHLGFEENAGTVGLTIERAVRRARSGAWGAPRYAATRADVLAHSQGGLLAVWYAADLPDGIVSRGPGYPPAVIRRTDPPADGEPADRGVGRWRFLHPLNWNAGPIHRLITIGSPLRGTPIASVLAPVFADTPTAQRKLRQWRHGERPMPAELRDRLWPPPNGRYLAPTALPDLAEGGPAQAVLGGTGPLVARFPAGRAAVAWLAIGTTWDGDVPTPPDAAMVVRAAHALLGVDPDDVPAGVSDALAAIRTIVRLMGAGTLSDLVVPLTSQFALDGGAGPPDNRRFRPWIAHSAPFRFLGETQLRSPGIRRDVRRALSQPPGHLRLEVTVDGPAGVPRRRSRHAFGPLRIDAR